VSFYNDRQKDRFEMVGYQETGNDSERLVTPGIRMQTLVSEQGIWYVKDHATDTLTAISGNYYIPTFRVRGISVVQGQTAYVMFDEPLTDNCLEFFNPGIVQAFHVTRVHLTGDTTATRINLHG
jgi:hypothetical protein